MPTAPLSPCPVPGCNKKTAGGRCERHRKDQEREERHRMPHHAFYDSMAWRKLSQTTRSAQPICPGWGTWAGECGRPTKHTDHKIALQDGGARLDPANVWALCDRCHGEKTRAEGRSRASRRRA